MNAVSQIRATNFSGKVVDKTTEGFITKVEPRRKADKPSYFVFLGSQPTDLKRAAGISAANLAAARIILGHEIQHPVKLTTPRDEVVRPSKGK